MNSKELEFILMKDSFVKSSFQGCFASDEIDSIQVPFPSSYILNYDPRNEPGSHWVAVYYDTHGQAEYLDSYGLPPMIESINTFLERNSTSWRYNEKLIQGFQSRVCGHYCIFYLLHRYRNLSMEDIVHMFGKDLNQNDKEVLDFVEELY